MSIIRGKVINKREIYCSKITIGESPWIERNGKFYDKTTFKEIKLVKKTLQQMLAEYHAELDRKIAKANNE